MPPCSYREVKVRLLFARSGEFHPNSAHPMVDIPTEPVLKIGIQIHGNFIAWKSYVWDGTAVEVRDWRLGQSVWVCVLLLYPIFLKARSLMDSLSLASHILVQCFVHPP